MELLFWLFWIILAIAAVLFVVWFLKSRKSGENLPMKIEEDKNQTKTQN